eukprot:g767.t1
MPPEVDTMNSEMNAKGNASYLRDRAVDRAVADSGDEEPNPNPVLAVTRSFLDRDPAPPTVVVAEPSLSKDSVADYIAQKERDREHAKREEERARKDQARAAHAAHVELQKAAARKDRLKTIISPASDKMKMESPVDALQQKYEADVMILQHRARRQQEALQQEFEAKAEQHRRELEKHRAYLEAQTKAAAAQRAEAQTQWLRAAGGGSPPPVASPETLKLLRMDPLAEIGRGVKPLAQACRSEVVSGKLSRGGEDGDRGAPAMAGAAAQSASKETVPPDDPVGSPPPDNFVGSLIVQRSARESTGAAGTTSTLMGSFVLPPGTTPTDADVVPPAARTARDIASSQRSAAAREALLGNGWGGGLPSHKPAGGSAVIPRQYHVNLDRSGSASAAVPAPSSTIPISSIPMSVVPAGGEAGEGPLLSILHPDRVRPATLNSTMNLVRSRSVDVSSSSCSRRMSLLRLPEGALKIQPVAISTPRLDKDSFVQPTWPFVNVAGGNLTATMQRSASLSKSSSESGIGAGVGVRRVLTRTTIRESNLGSTSTAPAARRYKEHTFSSQQKGATPNVVLTTVTAGASHEDAEPKQEQLKNYNLLTEEQRIQLLRQTAEREFHSFHNAEATNPNLTRGLFGTPANRNSVPYMADSLLLKIEGYDNLPMDGYSEITFQKKTTTNSRILTEEAISIPNLRGEYVRIMVKRRAAAIGGYEWYLGSPKNSTIDFFSYFPINFLAQLKAKEKRADLWFAMATYQKTNTPDATFRACLKHGMQVNYPRIRVTAGEDLQSVLQFYENRLGLLETENLQQREQLVSQKEQLQSLTSIKQVVMSPSYSESVRTVEVRSPRPRRNPSPALRLKVAPESEDVALEARMAIGVVEAPHLEEETAANGEQVVQEEKYQSGGDAEDSSPGLLVGTRCSPGAPSPLVRVDNAQQHEELELQVEEAVAELEQKEQIAAEEEEEEVLEAVVVGADDFDDDVDHIEDVDDAEHKMLQLQAQSPDDGASPTSFKRSRRG